MLRMCTSLSMIYPPDGHALPSCASLGGKSQPSPHRDDLFEEPTAVSVLGLFRGVRTVGRASASCPPLQDRSPRVGIGGMAGGIPGPTPYPPSHGDLGLRRSRVVGWSPLPPGLRQRQGAKNGQKMAIFDPLACKVQRGWGGSAHYPDPTAQSAFSRPRAPRHAPPGPSVVRRASLGVVGQAFVGRFGKIHPCGVASGRRRNRRLTQRGDKPF